MELFYYKTKGGNFGDDLNGWLWQALLPNCWDPADGKIMTGIGTIIGEPLPYDKTKIIFSSGIGYRPVPEGFGGNDWQVVSVRGPLTAEVLGISRAAAVTDGAILLALVPEGQAVPEAERHGTVFMPHHEALHVGQWQKACELAGIEFLDPRDDSKKTLARLRTAKLVLADAMHAAIVADTVRVPWVPLVTSSGINSFKWLDWCQSMGLGYIPIKLPASSLGEEFTSWLAKVCGLAHQSTDLSHAAAIANYSRELKRKTSLWGRVLRKFVSQLTKLVGTLDAIPGLSGLIRKYDERQVTLAAQALRQAAATQPCQSADDVFNDRLNEMARRLQQIEAKALPGKKVAA